MGAAVDLSCVDWWDRLQRGQSIVPSIALSDEGERAVRILDRLRLFDVPGNPTFAEAGADWFRDIARGMFGTYDPATGLRSVRESFTLIPKKNGKTSYSALLMVTALLMNRRPNAKFLMTGAYQSTAQLAFDAASGAIRLDPVLSKKFHIRDHLKTIVYRETGAQLQILTFEPNILTGQKISGGCLIDELHVCGKMPRAGKALEQIRGGMLPFPESFLCFITTQSDDPPVGVFQEELMRARAIRDGEREGDMLPVLYEFPQDIQESGRWEDTALWPLITPNLGRSVQIEDLVAAHRRAVETNEAALRVWASQHLNVQIGIALSKDSWAGAEFWEGSVDESITLDTLLVRSEVVVCGIDGGGLDDLLGFAVLGREAGTRRWLLWAHAWAHEIVLERRKEIVSQLGDLQKAGDVTIVGVPGQDVTDVADIICQIRDSGLLPEKHAIGVDPAGIGAIVDELLSDERGIEQGQITAVSQGWRLNGAIKTTERAVAGGELVHAGQRLMAWAVGNARIVPAGNAVTITKQISGSAKIDPLMATFNAVSLMSLNPEARACVDDFLTEPVIG